MNRTTLARLPEWLQELLERMDEEMVLRGFTRQTRRLYLAHVRRFYERRIPGAAAETSAAGDTRTEGTGLSRAWKGSSTGEPLIGGLAEPGGKEQVPADSREVREWLLHLLRTGRSHSYTNQALSALRFLHRHVLNAPAPVAGIPRAYVRSGRAARRYSTSRRMC